MTAERRMRASDDDRERVAKALREAYAVGRLRWEEFTERTDTAFSASTWGELDELTEDLPGRWDDISLPSDVHASLETRRADLRTVWALVLLLAAMLATLALAAAPWAAAILIPLTLALPFGIRCCAGRRPPR
jgi:hypothetical protein